MFFMFKRTKTQNLPKAILTGIFILPILFTLAACEQPTTVVKTPLSNPTINTTVKPDSVIISAEGITLKNDRLKIDISQPGKDYTASRFDWAGIVKQVTLDGENTFASTEKSNFEFDSKSGYGLMGQFEPSFARMTDGEYTVTSGNNSVIFTKNLPKDDKGRGYKLVKTLTVDGNKLAIKCVLTNHGDKAINFGEYNHNFTIIDKKPVGPDYELKFSFTPTVLKSPVTGGDLFTLSGDTLTWNKVLEDKNEFLCQMTGFEEGKKDYFWQLTHKPSGVGVKATSDFELVKIQLWGKAHTICPEIFLKQKVEPYQTLEWTRTYEFFQQTH
jgi:hypothetical protein